MKIILSISIETAVTILGFSDYFYGKKDYFLYTKDMNF
jgi:hypothetical protein